MFLKYISIYIHKQIFILKFVLRQCFILYDLKEAIKENLHFKFSSTCYIDPYGCEFSFRHHNHTLIKDKIHLESKEKGSM